MFLRVPCSDHCGLGVGNLRVFGTSPELAHSLNEVIARQQVRVAQETAVRVDRERAARAHLALGVQTESFATAAETHILELDHGNDRKAIIKLDEIDVAGTDPGL